MSENIQGDILTEVLARLPFKPLCRLKCVSKSWRDLIDSSYFKEMRPRRMCSPIPTVFDLSRMETSGPIEAEEVGNLLRRGNPYTKVCLRTRSFGIDAARVVALTLSPVKHHLKEVDLSGVVYGRTEAEAVHVMDLFSEALEGSVLKSLNLSHNPLGTEEGVRALGRILGSQTRLEELYLNYAGISDEAARAVAELLPRTDHLRVLEFLGNSMGSDGAIAISGLVRRCPGLENFLCTGSTWLDIKGCLALAKALQICKHLSSNYLEIFRTIRLKKYLTEIYLSCFYLNDNGAEVVPDDLKIWLDISGNRMIAQGEQLVRLDLYTNELEVDLSSFGFGRTAEALDAINLFSEALEGSVLKSLNLSGIHLGTEEGVRALGRILRSQTSLEEVYLNYACISDVAARAVVELLPQTDELRVLEFVGNLIGSDGAIAISGLVRRCPGLEDFRCSCSTQLDEQGCLALAEALQICTHLKKLDLSSNYWTNLEAAIALSNTIPLLQNLTQVYLSCFYLEDDGAEAVADALRVTAPRLQVLDLSGNGITAKAAASVAACIASKEHLVRLNLSTNRLGDDGALVISMALEKGHHELKEVDVTHNGLAWRGASAIVESVANKPEFEVLRMNTEDLYDEDVHELMQVFQTYPHRHLSLTVW